jgi:hypothetical protein
MQDKTEMMVLVTVSPGRMATFKYYSFIDALACSVREVATHQVPMRINSFGK